MMAMENPHVNRRSTFAAADSRFGMAPPVVGSASAGSMRVLAALSVIGWFAATSAGDTIHMADGSRLEGVVISAKSGELTVEVGKAARRIPSDDVVSVEMGVAARVLMAEQGRHVAVAEDGSRLGLSDPSVADGKMKCTTAFGAAVIPLQAIACILRPAPHERPMDTEPLASKLGLKRGDTDVLVVSAGGDQTVAVRGILLRMSAGEVVIEYDGVESPLPGGTVRMVQMAKAASSTNRADAGAVLALADGSTLAVESLVRDGSVFTAVSPALGTVRVPREAVSAIRFNSAKVTALAELTPEVRQTGFFDEVLAWRKDRAVSGGPLQIHGKVYAGGIGMHARCEMTYSLAKAYRSFSAVVGIDDSVRTGSALVSVLADGNVLLAPVRVESGEAPREIRLDVKGVERMTFLVDFAEGTMGSGARVDLCNAVLSK